ncbi:CalY family protein [Cytobacillus oceanisediminis]|uniref:CalY family protein n=1 Tax=Cytobacillus TaxID=2675230 RepID=UPI00203FAFA6|nr:CalY family protein [Cytobacillus oceanisediminis]MCM3241808.1 CalY family protein [Cytobacillus oceanisediminis]MCM3404056.1 CalY family protein [Cytobacillus oceanisediminis]MDK7666635.1 CalY family protein [Cytobacillus oceanisediminis]
MSLKKKLGLGIASAALGISLVGGGTFAYFNDVETTNNTFAAGTLDLAVNPTTIIDVNNIKPGDRMSRTFKLENNGSLDISKVLINTNYEVVNKSGAAANSDDFGKHIRVNFLKNEDKNGVIQRPENIIVSTTLADLKGEMPDAVENKIWAFLGWGDEASGIEAGSSDDLYVQFEFVDNNADQNEFQGDSLKLTWKFDAKQTAGTNR